MNILAIQAVNSVVIQTFVVSQTSDLTSILVTFFLLITISLPCLAMLKISHLWGNMFPFPFKDSVRPDFPSVVFCSLQRKLQGDQICDTIKGMSNPARNVILSLCKSLRKTNFGRNIRHDLILPDTITWDRNFSDR